MLGKRIEECRNALGLSRADLAEKLDVGTNTVFRWEKGERSPSDEMKGKIAEVLSTSVSYLMEGEPIQGFLPTSNEQRLDVGINLDDPEVLNKVLSGLREKNIHLPQAEGDDDTPFPGEKEPTMPPQILLPVIDQDACAGSGFDYTDVEAYAVEWLPYPLDALGGPIGPHKPYFVKVSGDSMIGVGIEDGCMVAINPNVEVRNGDNVYVRWKGRCSIKGFIEYSDRIELRPAHPNYHSTWIPREDWEELKVLGKVVRVFNFSIPGSVL